MISDKQALIDWEKFRQNVRKSTPVNLSETTEEKVKRIKDLESDPQAWKKYYFPQYCKYESPDFHIESSEALFENFSGRKHYYIVRSWARGLAKSTVTMMDILNLVMTCKLRFIVLTSSTWDAATNFITKYQVQLDSNQRLINDYGSQELPGSWAIGDFTTRKGVRFLSVGAGQSPRGESNEEIRPDCIICDDFDTDEDCRNIDTINKKWDWFEKALVFTVDVSSPYLIIWNGNIIAEDCCVVRAGKISDRYEVINIRDAANRSVWPAKNSEEDIDYLLSIVSYESGQQEYFNNPIRAGRVFKELTYGDVPPIQSLPFIVIYADPSTSNKDRPALKSKQQNSCKAVGIIGSPDGIKFYVYKVFVDIVTNSDFIDWLYTCYLLIANKTQQYVFIENNTLQDPFYQQVFKPLIAERGKVFRPKIMLPITPDERIKPDKYFRIEGNLEPLNRNGQLILNIAEKDNPHMKRLEAQFKSVNPNSRTMDGPDMVEGGVFKIREKINATNPRSMVLGKRSPNQKRF
ncbi:hypothetical protein F0L74_05965 [Chitinophaga agrisoli]|uniref:Phage terminase large subunit-like protein n=1 Tax=Chitinophaga agrisoli TaxID=2607653 RepID=A0A5B2W489_9BACT|nr:hypothetical protein [Chitinophaga agrisoli]KAA2245502.1 hypothetical protein F0L74_05965 [Chitinophaga agrisoli]